MRVRDPDDYSSSLLIELVQLSDLLPVSVKEPSLKRATALKAFSYDLKVGLNLPVFGRLLTIQIVELDPQKRRSASLLSAFAVKLTQTLA